MDNIFKGLGVALITPFCKDGSVDFSSLSSLTDSLITDGIDFLCVLGSTAETPCLSGDERRRVKDCVVEAAGRRVPILLGMGSNDSAALANEIKNFDFRGVDGILSVVPYYNKPSQQGMYEHFKLVASAAGDRRVVLYNVPGRTSVNMQAATTLRLAQECDNIVAIKEASGSLAQIDTIIHNAPEGFDVLSGDDALAVELIGMGSCGVISVVGNAIPRTFAKMVRTALSGDKVAAETADSELRELYRLLFADGNPAGIKALLAAKGRINNVLRLPLTPATEETQTALAAFTDIC